jgi:ASC-1-like (ASCH) protein
MKVLTLPLKSEYFDAIVSGEKLLEYRLITPFWRKRLGGKTFDAIEITKGYPAKGDA